MGCNPSKGKCASGPAAPALGQAADDQTRKRRAGVSAQTVTASDLRDWKRPVHEKNETSKTLLRQIIQSNNKLQVLFGHLHAEQLDEVIMAMFPREVPVGEKIITQGDAGDAFWIVESGEFDIFVNRNPKTLSETFGDKVSTCASGACFGELALMYNAPRAATVVATKAGKVWGLDALSFKMMLVTAENSKKKKYESFLGKVTILSGLNDYERAALSDVIDIAKFTKNEVIMKQGDQGNNFYILEDGEASAYISNDGAAEVLAKHYTTPGEYFGELALLLATPRKATVYAGEQGCTLLFVSKEKFDRVLGPIKHRLTIEKYPQYADIIRTAKAMKDDSSDGRSPTSD
jgi:cAMP-dependent protein kinase regulator